MTGGGKITELVVHLRCTATRPSIRAPLAPPLGNPLSLPSHLMGPFKRKPHVMNLHCGGCMGVHGCVGVQMQWWVHADSAPRPHALTAGRSAHLQSINASRHARQGRDACVRERWGASSNAVLPIAGAGNRARDAI